MFYYQPIEPPEVIFVGGFPQHEHIYSNGFICMSILYDGWSPVMNINSIVLSIISMLDSSKEKLRPENDVSFCKTSTGKSPKDFLWSFDDDKC